jgi:hypothetical protein
MNMKVFYLKKIIFKEDAMKRIHKSLIACLVTMVLLLGTASFAYARPEFYLGVSEAYNSINTTATDIHFTDGYENEYEYVPALDPGNGFSVTFGMEFTTCALELGLTSSHHDGTDSAGLPADADYTIFDANFKKFIGESDYLKPYLLIGLCVTSLNVNDGSTNTYYNKPDDATFSGVGINLGYGLELKFSNIALKGEAIYRTVEYTSVSGVDTYDEHLDEDDFDGNGLCFNVGVNLYF